MHIYVTRALKTALVTGGLFAACATAAHAEVGGTGLDLNAEASVEVVTEATATEDVLVDVDATLGGTEAVTGTGTGDVVTVDAEVDLTGDAANEVVDVDAELLGGDLSEEQAADAADPATVDADVAIGGTDSGNTGTTGTDTENTGAGEVVVADVEVDLTGDASNEVVDVDAELLGGDLSEEQAADAADPATVDVDVAIGGTDAGTGETDGGAGSDGTGIGTDEVVAADAEVDLTGDASNEVVDVDAELLGGDLSEEQAADAADPATVDVDLAIGGTDAGAVGTDDIAVGADELAGADVDVDLSGDASNEVVDVDAELLGGDLSEEQAADAADPATVDVDLAIGGTGTDDSGTGNDTGGTGTDTNTGTDTDTGEVIVVDAEVDLGVASGEKTAGENAVVSTGGAAAGTGVLGAGRIVTVANLTHALTASGFPASQMSGTGGAALSTGSGSLPATGADGRTLGGLAVLFMVAGLALARRFGVQIS